MAKGKQRKPGGGFWLFQANPTTGDDLRQYLKGKKPGDTFDWRATHYRDPRGKMLAGDRVAMWQTPAKQPEAAGIYALGS